MNLVKLDWQFVFTIINILTLYVLMKKFLFKPVTAFMQRRTESIKAEIDEAKNKIREAEEYKGKYKELLAVAHIKAEEVLQDANVRAMAEYEQIILEARKEAEVIIVRANELIQNEKRKVLKNVKDEISSLAFAVASKIIRKNMDNELNRKIIEDFFNEEGAT